MSTTIFAAATWSTPAGAQDQPDDLREPLADISLLGGLGVRRATTSTNANPDGIAYQPGVAIAAQARGYASRWLSFSVYYARSTHELSLPNGAAGIDYDHIDVGSALAFSLGARLEPTLRVSDQFRAWASVGAAWGRMTLGKMTVTSGERQYTVQERAGVFMEVPFGIGAAFEFLPRWAAVSIEANVAPVYRQSGTLYNPVTFVDNRGLLDNVGGFPTQSMSAMFLLGLSAVL